MQVAPFSKSGGLADVCDKLGVRLSERAGKQRCRILWEIQDWARQREGQRVHTSFRAKSLAPRSQAVGESIDGGDGIVAGGAVAAGAPRHDHRAALLPIPGSVRRRRRRHSAMAACRRERRARVAVRLAARRFKHC